MAKGICALPVEPKLLATATYYVNGATGNDANSGLLSNEALRYIQTAINKIPKNMNGYTVTINVASWAGNNYDALSIKDFKGGKILLQGGASAALAVNFRIPYAYIEDCEEIQMIGFAFNSVQADYEGSLNVVRTVFNGTYLVCNADLTANNAIGLRFTSCPWVNLSSCSITTRSDAIAFEYGTTGKMDSMTYVSNSRKVGIGQGCVYYGDLSDISSNIGSVMAVGKGLTTDLATALDPIINAASEQTVMAAADELPVAPSAETAIKKITWANFVTAMKTAIADATQSVAGLMPYLDKKKLDGILKNQSVSSQTGFATDTYLVGSRIVFPFAPQVGTRYRCVFDVTKTNVGTATPIINVRVGTLGTTGDTSRGVLTFGAGTAAVDAGLFEVIVVFRTVGGTTAAVIQSISRLTSNLTTTGLSNAKKAILATSAGFDSTVAGLGIGLSYNAGASAVHTIQLVSAELMM